MAMVMGGTPPATNPSTLKSFAARCNDAAGQTRFLSRQRTTEKHHSSRSVAVFIAADYDCVPLKRRYTRSVTKRIPKVPVIKAFKLGSRSAGSRFGTQSLTSDDFLTFEHDINAKTTHRQNVQGKRG